MSLFRLPPYPCAYHSFCEKAKSPPFHVEKYYIFSMWSSRPNFLLQNVKSGCQIYIVTPTNIFLTKFEGCYVWESSNCEHLEYAGCHNTHHIRIMNLDSLLFTLVDS